MKLYHRTNRSNIESILKYGLLRNDMGIIYLSPTSENNNFGDVLLEVETVDARLSSLEDCEEWEIFCWADIPNYNIRIIDIGN